MSGQLCEIAIYRLASRETVLVVWESIKQLTMELAGAFAGSQPIFRCPPQQLLKVLFCCHCILLSGTL